MSRLSDEQRIADGTFAEADPEVIAILDDYCQILLRQHNAQRPFYVASKQGLSREAKTAPLYPNRNHHATAFRLR